MTQNIWFALPSLTVILIQSWICISPVKRSLLIQSKPLALLFFGLLGICLIEFGTYTDLILPSLMTMKLYYVSCFTALIGIFLQAIKVSGIQALQLDSINFIVSSLFGILSILMLTTDLFISGFEFISYSYTRDPGNYYWMIQLFLITFSLLTIVTLSIASKKSDTTEARRSKVLLLSISPLLLFAISLIALMQLGLELNSSMIFPLFIAYFFLVALQTEKDESLFSLLIKVPYSKERRSLNQITRQIQSFLIETELSRSDTNNTNLSLKSLTSSIENLIVEHAVELNNGSQVKAASLLGVSSSSICRKKSRN